MSALYGAYELLSPDSGFKRWVSQQKGPAQENFGYANQDWFEQLRELQEMAARRHVEQRRRDQQRLANVAFLDIFPRARVLLEQGHSLHEIAQAHPLAILDVDQDAQWPAIRRAYHDLARRYHPDRNQDPHAHQIMQALSEARDVAQARLG